MITFSTIIKEAKPHAQSDSAKILAILQKNCSQFLINYRAQNNQIYRGVKWRGEAYVVNPMTYTRKNTGISTFNDFIAHSPAWKNFPSRYQCIIGSTRADVARNFSAEGAHKEDVFIVAPFNNAIIGECKADSDVWRSGLFTLLKHLTFLASGKVGLSIPWEELVSLLDKNISNDNLDDSRLGIFTEESPVMKFIRKFQDSDAPSILDFMYEQLTPIGYGFDVVQYSDSYQPNGMSEVWTSSKCVLVRLDILNSMTLS